jgi:streptogramin lyase
VTRLLVLLAAAVMPLTASAGSVRIDVGRGPCCIVFARGGIWVGNHRDVSVQRIDPLTHRAAMPIVVAKPAGATGGGSNLGALVTNGKALFVLDGGTLERSVTRIDPATYARTVRRLGNVRVLPYSIAVGANSVWVTSSQDAKLWQLDPVTLAVRSTTSFANAGPLGTIQLNLLTASSSAVWAVNESLDLLRIDPRTRKIVKTIRLFTDGFATGEASRGALWIASSGQHKLFRVDTATGRVTRRVALGKIGDASVFPLVESAGDGSVWLQTDADALKRLDPTTGRIVRTIRIPIVGSTDNYFGSAILHARRALWVTVWPGGSGGFTAKTRGFVLRFPP